MITAADSMDASPGTQDASPLPRAEAATAEPWFTAAQIAERVGREKRVVLLWMGEGLPSRQVPQGRNRKAVKQSQMSAVMAYMRGKGLLANSTAMEGVSPAANGTNGTHATNGMQERPGEGPPADDLFEQRVVSEVEIRLADAIRLQLGAVDFAKLMGSARAAMERLVARRLHPSAEVAEEDKHASAIERCSRVIERLDKARFEAEQREKKWLERDVARRMMVSQAVLFNADLTSLDVDAGKDVVAALVAAGLVSEANAEAARRVAAVAERELVDRVRERRAQAIREAVGGLEANGT